MYRLLMHKYRKGALKEGRARKRLLEWSASHGNTGNMARRRRMLIAVVLNSYSLDKHVSSWRKRPIWAHAAAA